MHLQIELQRTDAPIISRATLHQSSARSSQRKSPRPRWCNSTQEMAECFQLTELVSGQSDFFVLSGVGVDSQKNEVSKSEKDAETSYHCCAQVSSKAEQSAVR